MMRPLALAALAALALAGPAAAQERRTVSWFLAHPGERAAVLEACMDDEALARLPVCANAQRAADRVARQAAQRPRATPTPEQILRSPSYYAENRIAQAIVLDRCARGQAPAAQCAAARAAGR